MKTLQFVQLSSAGMPDYSEGFRLAADGGTAQMVAKPRVRLRVQLFFIKATHHGVVIDSVMVGDEEQLVSAGIPIEVLTEFEAEDLQWLPPVGPFTDLTIVLRNTRLEPVTGTITAEVAEISARGVVRSFMSERVPLQAAVRETRALLAAAWTRDDRARVIDCIAELRHHAERAQREAGGPDEAFRLLRQLADEHEARLRRLTN